MIDLATRLEQEAEEITCYASTTVEYRPNATALLLRKAASALRARYVDVLMAEILQGRAGQRIACPCCGFVVGSLQENHDTNG